MSDDHDLNPDDPDATLIHAMNELVQPTRPPQNSFPAVIGNALICSDGSAHQLRILDKLYLRCGITTAADLERAYAPHLHDQQG